MKNRSYLGILLAGAAFSLVFPNSSGRDWTQYRGSNHDGVSSESIRLNWKEKPPKALWKVSLPNGLSSFSVDAGRLYTMGSRQNVEYCIALAAESGRELWSAPIGQAFYPNGGVGSDDGARSTPSVDGDRVYAFGAYMNLVCVNAINGAEIWRHDLQTEFGAYVIPWQNAASPLVAGDLVLVNGNGRTGEHLLAFRKSDGVLVWKTGSDGMTQATPVRGRIGGVEQAIFFAQSGLVSVAIESGAVLWRYPIVYNGTSVAASPVIAGETVYASRAYPRNAGAVVVQINSAGGKFTASKIWDKPNQLLNHWATPVFYNGYYYGMYGQSTLNFRAVDASNGDTKWSISGFGYGSVTRVNDKLLALSEEGELALVDTNPEAYTELARLQPLQGRCWNNPAVSDGRIYIRSTTEAVALDVSLPVATSPIKMEIARGPDGGYHLAVFPADGSALDSSQASRLSIHSAGVLGSGAVWNPVPDSTVLAEGKLQLAIPKGTGSTLFFRAEISP